MSAKEKAFRNMVDGTPWRTITKTHSKSSIYAAYVDFEPHMEKRVSELCQEVQEFEDTLDEVKKQLNSLTLERDRAESVIENTIGEAEEANSQLEHVMERLEQAESELSTVTKKLDELQSKGITIELFSEISEMDIVNNQELNSRIVTAENYAKLLKDHAEMESDLEQLQNKKEQYQTKVERLSEEEKSTANKVALVKSEHSLIIDAVNVTQQALKKYPKKDLMGLFKEINRIEIHGEPRTTLVYMLDRLDKVKEELELERSIVAKRAELETIVKEASKAKGILTAYRDGVIRPIQEAEQAFKRAMQEETRMAKQEITDVGRKVENRVNELAQISDSAIQATQERGEQRLKGIENAIWSRLLNISLVLEARIDNCIEETDKWGRIKEEAGQYTYYLNQAIILFSPLTKPDAILALDPWVVKQIAKRLHLYSKKKLAGVKTKFPKNVASREWAISEFYDVEISSVAEALAQMLETCLREG
jgi:chromosome segregation ATPase